MEKRKQREEKNEAGRRQKIGYKRNVKERASGNIQTQNRVYEGHPPPTVPKWKGLAIHYAPSVIPIYPSTPYYENAMKRKTRERTWT
jgi:hypothetical protein